MLIRNLAMALALAAPLAVLADAPAGACHLGAYAMSDGSTVLVQPSANDDLRYRFLDGASGRLFHLADDEYESGEGWAVREPATLKVRFAGCEEGRIRMRWSEGREIDGKRIRFPIEPVRFRSGEETLYGELFLPPEKSPRAVVILQYGGAKESAVINNYVQYLLPLHGFATFVFDKRGTGRSGGKFNAHIGMLADDMVAATGAVRALPAVKGIPLGLMGESQGGWVAPLAASRKSVDFVIASYGMAVSMIEEDRQEVAQSLRMAGYGNDPEVMAKGEELHRAAIRVMQSRFREGLGELERLKDAYGDEPWFARIEGDFTRTLSHASAEELPQIRAFFDFPYDIAYDPAPVIAALEMPQLWILAGSDTEAPHEASLEILRSLREQGRPIDIKVFEQAEHGMIAVEEDAGERRLAGRTVPGYFELLAEWIGARAAAMD